MFSQRTVPGRHRGAGIPRIRKRVVHAKVDRDAALPGMKFVHGGKPRLAKLAHI